MNKTLASLLGLAGLALSGTAAAVPMTATETLTDEEHVNAWLNPGDVVTWEHTYTFEPDYSTILDATLTLKFYDDERDGWFWGKEVAIGGILGSYDLALEEIDPGYADFDIGVGEVGDGVLSIWAASLVGDFGIGSSVLKIDYEPVGVPEPGALLLLGTGLVGAGLIRRRRRAEPARG